MLDRTLFRARAALLAATALCLPVQAMAQADPGTAEDAAAQDEPSGESEIVVTGSFMDSGAQSATKLDARALDVPLSISSYSENFLDSIDAGRVSDLYKYMTGVQRAGRSGVSIILRGFGSSNNDRNAIMVDGLPGLSGRQSPSTAGTHHIEVVKGPASLLYGQVQPGGFVNIITKKPSASRSTEIELSGEAGIGKLDRGRGLTAMFDTTGAFSSDETFLYRLIVEKGYSRGFRADGFESPLLVAPSLAFQSGGTSIILLGEYQRVREHYDSFLVAPGNDIRNVARLDTSYQEPRDWELNEGGAGTLLIEQELSPAVTLNASGRYVYGDNKVQVFEPISFRNATTVARRARQQHNIRTYAFADINLRARLEIGGIAVKTVFGANYGRETSDLNRLQFYNAPATGPNSLDVSVIDPQIGFARPIESYPLFASAANLTHRVGSTYASGIYASALVEFSEHFKAMLGLRYGRELIKVREVRLPGGAQQRAVNEAWLPTVGLLYQPNQNLTFYGSYSTSFSPVQPTAVDRNGIYSFRPTTGEAFEGGVKAELFDDRLKVTAAYFDITKKDTINSSQNAGGTVAEQIGEEKSNGFEFEIDYAITPNWQIIGGFASLDPRITKSNIPNQVGARLDNAAKFSAQAFTRYDFPEESALAGWGLGFGISHTGARHGILPTLTSTDVLRMSGYTIADAAIYYQKDGLNLTFKVSNLTDETYFENVGTSGATQVQPGLPRMATLTLSFKM